MQNIRRTVLAITATLFAIVAGSGTALAGPKPLPPSDPGFIERESGSGGAGASSSGGFFDSWPQVTLSILVVIAVLATFALALSRMRHHQPTTA